MYPLASCQFLWPRIVHSLFLSNISALDFCTMHYNRSCSLSRILIRLTAGFTSASQSVARAWPSCPCWRALPLCSFPQRWSSGSLWPTSGTDCTVHAQGVFSLTCILQLGDRRNRSHYVDKGSALGPQTVLCLPPVYLPTYRFHAHTPKLHFHCCRHTLTSWTMKLCFLVLALK